MSEEMTRHRLDDMRFLRTVFFTISSLFFLFSSGVLEESN